MTYTRIDTAALLSGVYLPDIVGGNLRLTATTKGGEYHGPCPFCGGRDRFMVWPRHPSGRGRWLCRRCGERGDAIELLRKRDGLSFIQAVKALVGDLDAARPTARKARPLSAPQPVTPPSEKWQRRALAILEMAQEKLWADENWALHELRRRGLTDETIKAAALGVNSTTWHDDPELWGLSGKPIWLPRGVLVPWFHSDELWRLNIRRPNEDVTDGGPKYIGPRGWAGSPLYGVDDATHDKPVILVEGEIDALTLAQQVGDLVTPLATGTTSGGRRERWITPLALAPLVLVAFDADEAGDKAAGWWVRVLPNAKRWRPFWGDANAMAQDGVDLRVWVEAALDLAPSYRRPVAHERDGTMTLDQQRSFMEELAAELPGAVVIPIDTRDCRAPAGNQGPTRRTIRLDGQDREFVRGPGGDWVASWQGRRIIWDDERGRPMERVVHPEIAAWNKRVDELRARD